MSTSNHSLDPAILPLTHLAMFLGLRANELIVERGHAKGFRHFRESHGFVVQHLIDAERSITELARRMDVSQQAVSKTVTEMQSLGIVELAEGEDRRMKRVRLTTQGWRGVRFARRARESIDKRLCRAVGKQRYEDARAVMLESLEVLGGVDRIRTRRIRRPL